MIMVALSGVHAGSKKSLPSSGKVFIFKPMRTVFDSLQHFSLVRHATRLLLPSRGQK